MTDSDLAAASAAGMAARTAERFAAYLALLRRWNPAINLVAPRTLPSLWERHVLDSIQLLDLAPTAAQNWVDLGSGGGFPGLAVAILAQERRPSLRVALIEADRRKAAFLAEAARAAAVNVQIWASRIEEVPSLGADVVSARALAPPVRLWPLAARHLGTGGTALFLRGADPDGGDQGLDESGLEVERLASRTASDSVVLRIRRRHDG